jgi:hypothetical protein
MIFARNDDLSARNRPPISNGGVVIASTQKAESSTLLPFPANEGKLNFRLID